MREKNVHALKKDKDFSEIVLDPLTQYLRDQATALLREALREEVETVRASFAGEVTAQGRARVVRNGYHPERSIQTGIGAVTVKEPRLRDRTQDPQKRIRFKSSLLPRYLRRTRSMEALIPCLYLKGVSTGDFDTALSALLGTDAPGLSASTIARLKQVWEQDYKDWSLRSLKDKRYVYLWVDGIYSSVRMDRAKQCVLVVMGATPEGKKELVAMTGGYRESEECWLDLLRELRRRGLTAAPKLVAGDGALGFWKAVRQVYPDAGHQRCWVHKTANVLSKMPKSVHPKAKAQLHAIYVAEKS